MSWSWTSTRKAPGYPIPRCPHCQAAYFACKTDSRGICVKKPKDEDKDK